VLNQSSGIFSNFGAEKPPLRQAAGTLAVIFQTTIDRQIIKKNKYGI